MGRLIIFRVIVFLAAFLLFQVELIASRALLPGFGGSYLVWADLEDSPGMKRVRPWTDKYSNLLSALKSNKK